MRGRRRSAPDIHRRAPQPDRTPIESTQKVISFERIDSQRLSIQGNSTVLTRRQYSTSGMLSSFKI